EGSVASFDATAQCDCPTAAAGLLKGFGNVQSAHTTIPMQREVRAIGGRSLSGRLRACRNEEATICRDDGKLCDLRDGDDAIAQSLLQRLAAGCPLCSVRSGVAD